MRYNSAGLNKDLVTSTLLVLLLGALVVFDGARDDTPTLMEIHMSAGVKLMVAFTSVSLLIALLGFIAVAVFKGSMKLTRKMS